MGQPLSISHSLSEDSDGGKAIMLFSFENGAMSACSVYDFFEKPEEFAAKVSIIIEPYTEFPPPISPPPKPPIKISEFSSYIRSFRISQYQSKSHRLFVLSNKFIAPSLTADALSYLKSIDLDKFASSSAVLPSDVFTDPPSSIVSAFRPQSASMRSSSPLRAAGQLNAVVIRRSLDVAPSTQLTFTDESGSIPRPRSSEASNQILLHLYIGSEKASADRQFLVSHGITHIVNLNGSGSPSLFTDIITYCVVQMQDSVFEELGPDFWNALKFVKKAIKKGGTVLIHCRQGISRSAALCAAYIMEDRGVTCDQAIAIIQKQRPSVNINQGFIEQLKAREGMLKDKKQSLVIKVGGKPIVL